ncbi:MAG: hypothetical protein Q9194_006413 [Teloschistes cf. exilis]
MTTMNAMQALLLNNAVCRKIYLQDNGKPYDQILVGAIIARKGTGVDKAEILLVKRAADEGNSHSTWEIPRGKVEDSDATLFDAVKREIREKTGIQVIRVLGAVQQFDYMEEREDFGDGGEGKGEEMSVGSMTLQFIFVCEGATHEIRVNAEEYSEGRFVGPEMIDNLDMTEQMRAVVDEGLAWDESCLAFNKAQHAQSLFRRLRSSSTRSYATAFSQGPAPPRLPKEEQELYENLQRSSTGAFSTPKPNVVINQSPASSEPSDRQRPQINQSPLSQPSQAQTTASESPRADESGGKIEARVQATGKGEELHPDIRRGARPDFEGERNPTTGEVGGPKNEPLRWGGGVDWSYNGRVTDF